MHPWVAGSVSGSTLVQSLLPKGKFLVVSSLWVLNHNCMENRTATGVCKNQGSLVIEVILCLYRPGSFSQRILIKSKIVYE